MNGAQEQAEERRIYGMAPLIRFTLLALYAALVAPLPIIAPAPWKPVLWTALAVGWILVMAITSERVILDGEGVQLGHPAWCGWWLRRGWRLRWDQVEGLTPVGTSQGGRVFYVRTSGPATSGPDGPGPSSRSAFLLPQRVARLEDFLARFTAHSGIPTDGVARISPPWTYGLLAGMSVALLAGELVSLVRLG